MQTLDFTALYVAALEGQSTDVPDRSFLALIVVPAGSIEEAEDLVQQTIDDRAWSCEGFTIAPVTAEMQADPAFCELAKAARRDRQPRPSETTQWPAALP